jgi:hypothetical protein
MEEGVIAVERSPDRVGPGKALAIWVAAGILGWGVVIVAILALI